FPDGGGAKERRVEMRVHLPFSMHRAIGRLLMEAHRIGKWRVEEAVVKPGQLGQDLSKREPFPRVHLIKSANAATRQDHGLERPSRPERHEHAKIIIGEDHALATPKLLCEIVEE